ncbi:TIGR02677 family protein [Caldicellulosiruptor acetigenus]|uniref:TIGR02677 family protein n=1 Tax=Caldicellulosiruptor acetigenus 6A TaxID=632516 RepID=G2PW70_9FIRM|nr:TIGR02677 family protein [Caldicellulosiruptor acetigenus]AEM74671.1 Conserved hypothetical protein CHP02677 [Caldicellulosiruptor acetigenus 6A]
MINSFQAPLLGKLKYFEYLTAPNSERYRTIMRYCFLCHLEYKNRLTKEEIFTFLKNFPQFADYTEQMCEQDLKSLVEWGNLNSIQDTSKTRTVEEFKNKRFLYELTPIGLKIERFLFELETQEDTKAELNPKHIEKIYFLLQQVDSVLQDPQKRAVDWWDELTRAFEEIEKSYSEYISMLKSYEAENLMIKEKFLDYKSKLVQYLYNFYVIFQNYLPKIRSTFLSLEAAKIEKLLNYIIAQEKEHPKNIFKDPESIEKNIKARFDNIKLWFVAPHGQAEKLSDQIQGLIRKVSDLAARLSEMSSVKVNRQEEYKHLAKIFSNLDLATCHKLSAVVFGVLLPRYIAAEEKRQSELASLSILDVPPMKSLLHSRGRLVREKSKVLPASEFSEDKKKRFEEYKKKIEEEEKLVAELIKDGKIEFENLPVLTPQVRKKLLVWLSRGLSSGFGNTDSGKRFKVVRPKDGRYCVLKSTDGELEMPAYVIEFVE